MADGRAVCISRRIRRAIGTGLLLGVATVPLDAQHEVRGTVYASPGLSPIDRAVVMLEDSVGGILGRTVSDTAGRFAIVMPSGNSRGYLLAVRRLGFQQVKRAVRSSVLSDRVHLDIIMVEIATVTEAVTITARKTMNEVRLEEATRRGWRVYGPELVAPLRDRASSLPFLLRMLGVPGLILPRGMNDCVRTVRNNQCLAYVLDGIVMSSTGYIQPSDVYFIALLGSTDSRSFWGEAAPHGAIAIYTRSGSDRRVRETRP